MIIRVLHAKVRSGKQAMFKHIMELLAIPHVRSRNGMVAVYPGQPIGPDSDEFILVTVWKEKALPKNRSVEDWLKTILPEEALPFLEEIKLLPYEAFGIPDHPRKPLFNTI